MQYDPHDTITAIGTAPSGALRGMVRVSGPGVLNCLANCFRAKDSRQRITDLIAPTVVQGNISATENRPAELPCDLYLWPGQRSYTKQPTAELHTLGSPPLLETLVRTFCKQGARMAQPGEFTLRAFLAGRVDLTQAEAVLRVIDSSNDAELQTALAQLAGGLSQPLSQLREQLLQLVAELEAGLDFVEEDIEFISSEQICEQLSKAQARVSSVADQLSGRAEAIDLPRVVLIGPPNAGKSSLFNALVRRFSPAGSENQSLVSDRAGTTRDFVTAEVHFHGFPCELVDTAGLDAAAQVDSIDGRTQEMSREQYQRARLVLHCEDANAGRTAILRKTSFKEIVVRTKMDLCRASPLTALNHVACSSVDGRGLERLASEIQKQLRDSRHETTNPLSLTAARCDESLRAAGASLGRALELATMHGGEELIAAEVHIALHALGEVVGAVYTDDILDRIFGQFCIGK